MFKKVHIRLTLLFTGVCTLVIAIMSALYLFLSWSNIKNNSFMSFRTDIANFSSTLTYDSVISQNWLANIKNNYSYRLFIYENNKPLLNTEEIMDDDSTVLIDGIKNAFSEDIRRLGRYTDSVNHDEFEYSVNNKKYYVGIICRSSEKCISEIYAINPLKDETDQFHRLIFSFLMIILIAAAALFVFSYFFTKLLLSPVKKAHQQQAHFIAAASHEIRNPVNTIISALDAMETSDGEQQKEFSKIARKEGKRLALLTEDLLTLARSDNGSFTAKTAPVELDTLILDCYEAFIAPAKEKNISISVELPDENVPKAMADADRIKQVISIILSNAVSYTPDGGKIKIAYTSDNSRHIIRISDSGSGISAEDRQHIFERFYRADRSRTDRSHFGLGLSIAKEIIDLHKGSISVDDSELGGSCFVITLPLNN